MQIPKVPWHIPWIDFKAEAISLFGMSQVAVTENWYAALVKRLRARIRSTGYYKREIVRENWQIGRDILEAKRKVPYGQVEGFMSRLSRDLRCSRRELYYCTEVAQRFSTFAGLQKLGKEWWDIVYKVLPRMKTEETRRRLAELSESVVLPQGVDLIRGDFREVCEGFADNSIDLILTDPVYTDVEAYRDLGRAGGRILRPGTYLAAYAGLLYLPQVINALGESLEYHGKVVLRFQTGIASQIVGSFWDMCRDILVFSKGPGKAHPDMMSWIEGHKGNKQVHDFAQSEEDAKYFIEHLSLPGDLVLDPFAGSGSTLHAAHALKRRAVGIEINRLTYKVALGTFHE